MDQLGYPGLPGLLFSCLFSGALSTLSSSINSMSAVMWEDVMAQHFPHWTDASKTLCNKLLTVAFGVACLASSFVMLFVGGSLVAIAASILGAVLGPLLGVFFLATLVPWANWKGTLTGGVISAAFNLWIMAGNVGTGSQTTRLPAPTYGCELNVNGTFSNISTFAPYTIAGSVTENILPTATSDEGFLDWVYRISFIWYPLIGVVLTMFFGILFSLSTGGFNTKNVDPKYVAKYVRCAVSVSDGPYQTVAQEELKGINDYMAKEESNFPFVQQKDQGNF